EAVAPADPARCRRELGLDPARPVLMVTGGSQGARTLNNLLVELVRRDPGALRGWQVVHQCGRGEDEPVEGAYRLANVPALVCEFVREMATWWGAAELAVSRCGAGSVGEAWANQVPALFLPYPYHRDEHQRHNAAALVRAGGAVLARDHADTETNAREILPVLAALLRGAPRRAEMRAALRRLGPADGATRVARQLLDAAGTSTRPRSGLLSGP
ncbi:MAG TPA: UDP-N-acetylglucosamine--N-acetylmuramyl-(pentapeptide) pyrophosphoryl-undecaprenol N-acetylglucosamine transferase, partial [Phycisphaerales bacterium]|nr:UDP-N-acetylglucosamine--N-acetylmuramyl-(pentapeptide) pyrophosphoryl-undecaprenol N-acetylglucosamine transferase [Phycisphaerales bacterium]